MITAKDYFKKYLAWERRTSNLRSAKVTFEAYSSMDLEELIQESNAGNPGAEEELGERYLFGLSGLKTDVPKACELFHKAGSVGNPDALHMLAEVHRTTEFGCQDYNVYFDKLEIAAAAGSWKAMFNLACAYYKGRDAYQGYGPEENRFKALNWSTQCAIQTMAILEFYFTQNCSEAFSEYMQGVFALFVQSICVSARQLIRGDGVEKDIAWAKKMLTDAQTFYKHFFKMECSDFASLLKYCD